ncbi:hypothetical protein D910_10719 [Dendroctonus ponderosae]|uniref:Uncharacterized protein n=1 Tax=Dendroctonus ponderosae TaxID=77166 RepID=U4UJZ4_DENPD|nr:hypothetical protein D910_10719 [Dendroctonus ponderosae]
MKLVFIFVCAAFCASSGATPLGESTYHSNYKVADKELLDKQKKVLSLFKHINQHTHDEEHEEVLNSFKLTESRDLFTDTEAVDKIIEFYTNGYQMPKGEIFCLHYPEHREQAIALFDLFYYAKDFDTFYKTAILSRKWVNEGLFLYSYSVAIIHRPDTYGITLPPIYEIYPHYFFNFDTIQEAYRYKQTWDGKPIQSVSGKYPGYTIQANYSGSYLNLHPEQSLAYYLEDIGINSFYYTYYLYYPFWMSGTKYGISHDRRGDLYFFIHQQLFSRYYLERLSNGFGQISILDFDSPVETPYYPSLQYQNGLSFPERPRFAKLADYFYSYGQSDKSLFGHSYSYYKDYSRRIRNAIDRGYAHNKLGERVELYNNKFSYDQLSNLLQSNPDSPDGHFYGPWLGFARHLLGYSYLPLSTDKVAPSALEHLETSLRDPAFYQLYKHLMLYYVRYQSRLTPYTKNELIFPGVSIEKIELDRLITYFDEFYSDLSQAVYYSEEELKEKENHFFVRAKQYRLNHKPFTYKIHVKSDKDTKASVKIFIGPKYDEFGRYINISDNRYNFFELDKFVYDLKAGDNIIKRSSFESKIFAPDKTSYYDLYKKVLGALNDKEEFTVSGRENHFYFPQRYMLPKGSSGGHPFQFYFIVYPYKPYAGNKPSEWTYYYVRPGVGGPYVDDTPIYYPFDRPIKYGRMFYDEIPNAIFYETKIYHKTDPNSLTLTLLVLGLGAVAFSGSIPPQQEKRYKTVDQDFLDKQLKVLNLFKHIHQHSVTEEHVKISGSVTDPIQWLQIHKASFEKPEVVDLVIKYLHYDYILPKGVPFSIFTEEHLDQAVALFKLFYYAKDFETFYETAVVMRKFVNEGLFLYTTSVAVVHRQDTYGIILPPIYEIYPWFFFNTEVIQQAYKYKMVHQQDSKKMEEPEHNHIFANYSGHYLNLHWEQSLSYFLEDIGANEYLYTYGLFYPFWMDGEEFHLKNDYRGEFFLVHIQSLVARYYLERLSHGEGQISTFDWDVPFETPYYPSLQYPNGLPFPERPKFAKLSEYFYNYGEHINSKYAHSYTNVKNFERRIADAIDSGFVYDTKMNKHVPLYHAESNNEDINKFGNLLQGNPDSPAPHFYKNYTVYASHVLGYSFNPITWKHVAPSVLEHDATASRDPAYYQLLKRILGFYHTFQENNVAPYHKNELLFPGVTIEKIEMDRLITYFDQYYSDISNGVFDTEEELKADTFKVWAVQKRLNHKPFTYKIHVNSNQDTKAMVKVFIGPKYDEHGRYLNISENRWNFVPVDAFQWHLKTGENIIKRSSIETEYYGPDKTTYEELYKDVFKAHNGQGAFHVDGKESYFLYPQRLMLPIGNYNGLPYQFYFIVYPYKEYTGQKEEMNYFYPRPGTGGGYVDDYPVYYPFNKPIKFGKMFVTEIPNSFFYEAKIYHRTAEEAQVPVTQHHH